MQALTTRLDDWDCVLPSDGSHHCEAAAAAAALPEAPANTALAAAALTVNFGVWPRRRPRCRCSRSWASCPRSGRRPWHAYRHLCDARRGIGRNLDPNPDVLSGRFIDDAIALLRLLSRFGEKS